MLRLVLSQPLHSASPQRSSAPFNLLFLSVSDLFWSPRSLRSLSKEYTRTIMIVFLKQGKSPSQRGFPHGDFPSTHFPLSLSLSYSLTHTLTHTTAVVAAHCHQGVFTICLTRYWKAYPTYWAQRSVTEGGRQFASYSISWDSLKK